jgi:cob(I)alamin adenosyltransferase
MSIVTRTGDNGTTALMYNRRVPKCDPRVEACGCVDELNTALGVARAAGADDWLNVQLLGVQKDLITVMGELAVIPDDRERYVKDGFTLVTGAMTGRLDALVKELESQNISFKGWATPGATALSAALDVARTVCRRAERRACALQESGMLANPEILVFMNRLSDTLWLLARRAETDHAGAGPGSQTPA